MPWRSSSVKETRIQFVKLALKKIMTFTDLCERFEISTKTGYKWQARYRKFGQQGLDDLSRAPKSRPNDTSEETKKLILSIKEKFPHWGAKKITPYLNKYHADVSLPSQSTIGNILRRNGYTAKSRRIPRMAKASLLTQAEHPNHVWTIDFKGWWKTNDDKICEPLTIVDLYSRYIIYVDHIQSKSANSVWKILEALFEKYGKPNRIRSDNGPPFASLAVGRLSALSIRLIKSGITPEWIRPGKPQDNGSHERMHRTLKAEVALVPASTINKQREQFGEFKPYFNQIRPHEALDMKTPSELYTISDQSAKNGSLLVYPENYLERKVGHGGQISIHGHQMFISEILRGEKVGVEPVTGSTEDYKVYYGPIPIGSLNIQNGFERF